MGKLTEWLRDAQRSGVYRTGSRAPIADAVRGTALDLATVDLTQPLFAAFAQALSFPHWFGANWDALEDCLGDLSWREGDGQVLLLEGWGALSDREREVLLDVLASSAQFWRSQGRPFFAVFLDPHERLNLAELSCNG